MLARKRVIVVGLGSSGMAAARLCVGQGASVIGTDQRRLEQLSPDVRELPIELVLGGHEQLDFSRADLVVVSPGVPTGSALERAEQLGVEVIGELELGCRFVRSPIVCVGGTNGKSTTVALLADVLAAAGQKVFVGGNFGTPLSAIVVDRTWDCLVLEVSSFQLERAPSFHPHISVLLNLADDHLDRHRDFEEYARLKGNAFVRQTDQDLAIVPTEDAICRTQAERGQGRVVTFGVGGDYESRNLEVLERRSGIVFSLAESELRGAHNWSNAAAAIAAARGFGVNEAAVEPGLRRFRPLPHRMAHAGEVGSIPFYDDSKATNVGAAVTALLGLTEDRCVLIAGGRDKLGSYEPLVRALGRKGRAVVLMGEAADRLAAAIGDRLPVERVRDMEEAVERAYRLATPGDAVLLAPACSSYDMFASYAERGDRFSAAVRALGQRARAEAPS
ncbi:UDP-N-acetylmuramoyl-L-alanine--D-glutamate ligase [Myxococcota bacterium]